MNYEDEKTLTLARRTRKNLDYIYEKKRAGENVEEFTQLLNSMLGMVISLREEYFKGSHVSWEEVEQLGLLAERNDLRDITGERANQKSPKLQEINSFSQLITKLRHAFAHSCFDPITDQSSDQIAGIKVWNIPSGQDNRPENRVWEAEISEVQLKNLAYLIVDHIEKELGES